MGVLASSNETRSFSIGVLREIDGRCELYERQLDGEKLPAMLPHLEGMDDAARRQLLAEFVNISIEHLHELGIQDPADNILAANVELADELRSVFNDHAATIEHHADGAGLIYLEAECPKCGASENLLADADPSRVHCSTCGEPFQAENEAPNEAKPVLRIDRFELLHPVGSGTFGVVWKAWDPDLQLHVAVKLPKQPKATGNEQADFLSEARLTARLRHPNIVRVFQVGLHQGHPYIVSDFIVGQTLDDWLQQQHLDLRETVELCISIANALHHAHECGVVHRDLKPGNIMMDLERHPYVMDFGLAKRSAADATHTVDGFVKGTAAYMPPEQAMGVSSKTDRRSDVYALGVLLFELATGERPFRGTQQMLMRHAIESPPPKPRSLNPAIPKDLETIILRCLEKEPAKRCPTALYLAEELQRFLDGVPIQTRPVTRIEQGWRWCKRHKGWASAGGLAAVLVLGAMGWMVRDRFQTYENRMELSDKLATSAEVFGSRGKWDAAMKELKEAIALGSRDPIALEIKNVQFLGSLNKGLEAQAALDQLAARNDLGKHEASVRFLQGMNLLASDGVQAAEPYFLDAKRLDGLPESSRALINCMLAETSAEALREIRRAVDAEPYDHETRRFLIFMLYNMGRFDEARAETEAGTALFPSDPNFPILLAHIAAYENDLDEMERQFRSPALSQLAPRVREEYGKALKMLVSFQRDQVDLWDFARLCGVNSEVWCQPEVQQLLFDGPLDMDPGKQILAEKTTQDLIRQIEIAGNLIAPRFALRANMDSLNKLVHHGPRCFGLAYEPLAILYSSRTRGYLEYGKGNVAWIDQFIDKLQASFEAHPECFLMYARGQLLYVRGRVEEAAEAFHLASQQHSSFGDYPTASHFAAARAYFELHRAGYDNALRLAMEHARQRLSLPDVQPHHAIALYEIAVEAGDYQATMDAIAIMASYGLSDDERQLRLAKAEYAAGHYQAALEVASKVDRSATAANEAQALAQQSREQLQRIIESAANDTPETEHASTAGGN